MKPFAPPPPPGAQPPPLWGGEEHLRGLLGDRVELHTSSAAILEITAFPRAREYGEHFKAYYGPTIATRANAEREGRAAEFDQALDAFCDEWNRGTPDEARFEQEYLVAVGTKALTRFRQSAAAPRATSPMIAASSCGRDHIGQWLVGRST